MPRTRRTTFVLCMLASLVGGLVLAAPAYAAAPTVTSFSPGSGVIASKVVITGTGFTYPATVTIGGGASGTVTAINSTTLSATVGSEAATGKIVVTTPGGTATSSGTFTVAPGVLLKASVGPPGSAVGVKFSGLSPYEATDVYLDTTDIALVSADGQGAASATITVPASTAPGTHWISVVGRHSGYSAQAAYLVRTDSPTFGYSVTHRSDYAYENVLNPSTVGGLRGSWRTAGHGLTFNTPAVVAGVAYIGFYDGTVNAYNEATGAQMWSRTLGGAVMSSPAVVNGILYVGSYDHNVYALNAATGAQVWKYTTGDEIYSSPAVSGGVVYIGSQDDDVYALNATTGAFMWKYLTGGPVLSSPAVSNGRVFVGSNDDKIYALNASTGSLLWSYTTGNAVVASPALADGMVYVGSYDNTMYALRTSDGILQWSYTTGDSIYAAAAVANGSVYVGSSDGNEYALNEANGAVQWTSTPSSGSTAGVALYSGSTYADGLVYVSDSVRTYVLAASSGRVSLSLPTGIGSGYPVVLDGTVFIGDRDDGVLVRYTLSPDSGNTVHARPDVARLEPTIRA